MKTALSLLLLFTISPITWAQKFEYHQNCKFGPKSAPEIYTGDTYTTNSGKIFRRVSYKKFGKAWQAPNGVIWSEPSKGEYRNVSRNKPEDKMFASSWSEAKSYCRSIGGFLPRFIDFLHLFDFDAKTKIHYGSSNWTVYDIAIEAAVEVYSFFPEFFNTLYWTSSIPRTLPLESGDYFSNKDQEYALRFYYGNNVDFEQTADRRLYMKVICIDKLVDWFR